MFDKSTGHGNNVMVAQFVFLFLERMIFQETYTEMDIKTANHLLFQKTNRQQFSMVCTLIDHRNDIKMFKTLQWNQYSFTWVLNIDIISMVNNKTDCGKLLLIC